MLLNMGRLENFSDFDAEIESTDSRTDVHFSENEIDVWEIFKSVTSAQSSLIVSKSIWTSLEIKVMNFMIRIIAWVVKHGSARK